MLGKARINDNWIFNTGLNHGEFISYQTGTPYSIEEHHKHILVGTGTPHTYIRENA